MATSTAESAPTLASAPRNGHEVPPAPALQIHTVIQPSKGWRFINLREMIAYRDLLVQFVYRNYSAKYKQTVLGYVWAVVRPVFSMVVFTVIFGKLAKVSSDGVPYALFSYAALLPWTYFSTALTSATSSLTQQKGIFTKVYFPRMIIPLAPVITGLIDFAIASTILAGLMAYFGVAPTAWAFFVPVLVLIMVLTAFGAGLWLSSLSVQYRDVSQAMSFMVQLLMYAAPVVWPVSLITEKFPVWGETIRLVYGLYPMAGVIEGFRASLLGSVPMPWDLIALGAFSAVLLTITGGLVFRRMERSFADVA